MHAREYCIIGKALPWLFGRLHYDFISFGCFNSDPKRRVGISINGKKKSYCKSYQHSEEFVSNFHLHCLTSLGNEILNEKLCCHVSEILSVLLMQKPNPNHRKKPPKYLPNPPHTLLYDSEIHTAHFSILHIL